jgi:histidine triad (HIT) family protein
MPDAPEVRDPRCRFCSIVAGDSPAEVVLDDGPGGACAAFLDIRPLFKGHVLLGPRTHVETLADLPPELVEPLFFRARQLSRIMETGLGAAGSFVALNNKVSQSVPHLHVHVVPRNRKDGLRGFFWPRTAYDDDADCAVWGERIRSAMDADPSTPTT